MSDWEQRFEECIARERTLAVALVDASRAMLGSLGMAGRDQAEAERMFAERYAEWRDAADAISELARRRIGQG
jgi:hypothetical protein